MRHASDALRISPRVAGQTQHAQHEPGPGRRGELFVYVPDVDQVIDELRNACVVILREPTDVPPPVATA
jgi:hypothetical protein